MDHEVEQEFRKAVAAIVDQADEGRDIAVTPFDGHYGGHAGRVVCFKGSPPPVIILVLWYEDPSPRKIWILKGSKARLVQLLDVPGDPMVARFYDATERFINARNDQ